MRWDGKMCIFNGAFALEWVGGFLRGPFRSDFDRHCTVWQTQICLEVLRQGGVVVEHIEKRGMRSTFGVNPAAFTAWLPGWLAEDEYCMVPAQGGWWLLRVGVIPSLAASCCLHLPLYLTLYPFNRIQTNLMYFFYTWKIIYVNFGISILNF